ncbi:MocR-like pyridoxine biosynthesis transcription factor PdxR [Bradyrhizobium sp. AZCC 1721]|uniref:MocR-like pyridoxine biosynthesis transcription factor PdxR n=1 Tax=Bradyrhizobium sp. AZCC 1721 TaxID=3117016 RepID=UPI002FF2C32D
MSKRSRSQDVALGACPHGQATFRWLTEQLGAAMLDGRLTAGTPLPSSRDLARQYGIARGTVVRAFRQLQAEGFISSKVGAGTFVSARVPDQRSFEAHKPVIAETGKPKLGFSARGQTMTTTCFPLKPIARVGVAFRAYQPDLEAFPLALWSRIAARRQRLARKELLGVGDPLGYRPLREAVAAYLGSARGVVCDADQVVIVSSVQQALDLASRLLLNTNDPVWIEDPGFPGARLVLEAAELKPVPVPVDSRGIDVAAGQRLCSAARMAYVTPAHQVPLGSRLSLERRLTLLEWAHRQGSWIFEDDYDGEFRYDGSPFAALKSLDRYGVVLYSGSFSKMLFPALRLAYLVVPPALVDGFAAARSIVDRFPPTFGQAVLCDFIVEGHFARHLRSMRELYGSRLMALREGVRRLSGILKLAPESAGLEIVAWLPSEIDDRAAVNAAAERSVEVRALSSYIVKRSAPNGLVLGFAAVDVTRIDVGLGQLAEALGKVAKRQLA